MLFELAMQYVDGEGVERVVDDELKVEVSATAGDVDGVALCVAHDLRARVDHVIERDAVLAVLGAHLVNVAISPVTSWSDSPPLTAPGPSERCDGGSLAEGPSSTTASSILLWLCADATQRTPRSRACTMGIAVEKDL